MRRRIAALTVTALLTSAVGVSAEIYAPESLERDFRLEWEVARGGKGPAIEGYVYSKAMRTAARTFARPCRKRQAIACRCPRSTGPPAGAAVGCRGLMNFPTGTIAAGTGGAMRSFI